MMAVHGVRRYRMAALSLSVAFACITAHGQSVNYGRPGELPVEPAVFRSRLGRSSRGLVARLGLGGLRNGITGHLDEYHPAFRFRTMCANQSPNRIDAASLPALQPETPEAFSFARLGYPPVLCGVGSFNRIIPNYIKHMWMATADQGLAATLYGPCPMRPWKATRTRRFAWFPMAVPSSGSPCFR